MVFFDSNQVMDAVQESELSQLLVRIATDFQQHESAFEARSLAQWPIWCEENGYSFELLCDYGNKLSSRLPSPVEVAGLRELVSSSDKSTKTAELSRKIHESYPGLIELLEQDLSARYKEVEEIGSLPGGTGHEALKIAGIATATVLTGILLKKLIIWLRKPNITPEAREKLERLGPNMGVDAQKQAERLYTSSSYPRISGKALEKAKQKIVRTDQKIDDSERAAENRAMFWTKNKISERNTIKSLNPLIKKVKGEDGEIKLARGARLEAIHEDVADAVEDDIDLEISRIASYGESILGEEIGAWDRSLLSGLEDEGKQELEKAKNELVDETDKAIIDLEKQVVQKVEAVIEAEADLID